MPLLRMCESFSSNENLSAGAEGAILKKGQQLGERLYDLIWGKRGDKSTLKCASGEGT
jgi:hypothetical protein